MLSLVCLRQFRVVCCLLCVLVALFFSYAVLLLLLFSFLLAFVDVLVCLLPVFAK